MMLTSPGAAISVELSKISIERNTKTSSASACSKSESP